MQLTATQVRKAERTTEAVSDRPAFKHHGKLFCGKCFTELVEQDSLTLLGVKTKRYSCPKCFRGYSDKVFCEDCGYVNGTMKSGINPGEVTSRVRCGQCNNLIV